MLPGHSFTCILVKLLRGSHSQPHTHSSCKICHAYEDNSQNSFLVLHLQQKKRYVCAYQCAFKTLKMISTNQTSQSSFQGLNMEQNISKKISKKKIAKEARTQPPSHRLITTDTTMSTQIHIWYYYSQ